MSVYFSMAIVPSLCPWSCTLGYTEAATARAQPMADNNRHVQQHKVGSAKPDVTIHAGMHRHARWLKSQWRLNSRARIEEQRYNHRRSVVDSDPVMEIAEDTQPAGWKTSGVTTSCVWKITVRLLAKSGKEHGLPHGAQGCSAWPTPQCTT